MNLCLKLNFVIYICIHKSFLVNNCNNVSIITGANNSICRSCVICSSRGNNDLKVNTVHVNIFRLKSERFWVGIQLILNAIDANNLAIPHI